MSFFLRDAILMFPRINNIHVLVHKFKKNSFTNISIYAYSLIFDHKNGTMGAQFSSLVELV